MSTRRRPQDDGSNPVLLAVRRTFAAFRCVDCEHVYAGDIPAIFEDLPACPLCSGEGWIFRVLETDLSH